MNTLSGYVKAVGQIEWRKIALPDDLSPLDIQVRVEACGICGTDLLIAKTAKNWEPFGHEIAGVIERVGAGVEHLAIGQKVVLETSTPCGVCAQCRSGRVDLCDQPVSFWGRSAMGFSESLIAPACSAVPYDGLTPEVASLVEPAGVACDIVKTAEINLGDHVAIIGPGPIALMAIPIAFRRGATRVACLGRSHSRRRLEVAKELGAEIVALDGALSDENSLHHQFNHVLVTAPVDIIPGALDLLGYGGRLTYIGIGAGNNVISFDANAFHFRKLQLRASHARPALYFPIVVDLLKGGIIPGDKIISHRFQLNELSEAMRFARDDKENAVKVVVMNSLPKND